MHDAIFRCHSECWHRADVRAGDVCSIPLATANDYWKVVECQAPCESRCASSRMFRIRDPSSKASLKECDEPNRTVTIDRYRPRVITSTVFFHRSNRTFPHVSFMWHLSSTRIENDYFIYAHAEIFWPSHGIRNRNAPVAGNMTHVKIVESF